jgi:hypothetical protein
MNKLYYLLITLSVLSCNSKEKLIEYGSLKGNVFWKYNDFVGNRPDAGADISIYSLADSSIKIEATADVQGNYTFDSIPTGYYLLIVQSKNTRSDAITLLREIRVHRKAIERVFNSDLSRVLTPTVETKISYFDSLSNHYLASDKANGLRKYELYQDSANVLAKSIFEALPQNVQLQLGAFGSYPNKTYIKTVTINKGRAETIVTDFGITYL